MNKKGFTLIEVLAAIVIIGIALVSLIAANSSFSQNNGYGVELSTSEFLIEQIRTITNLLPVTDPNGSGSFGAEEAALADYDDLDDFDGSDSNGVSFCPPIDSERTNINDLSSFTQSVTVHNVSASNFETLAGDGTTDFYRVTVTIYHNGKEINSASWLRADY